MPGGNRRGPFGAGPLTGRGMGFCGGYDRPGWANPMGGRLGLRRGGGGGRGGGFGQGRGYGRGRGWGRGGGWGDEEWGPEGSPDERQVLLQRSEAMERELKSIRRRLKALEKDEETD